MVATIADVNYFLQPRRITANSTNQFGGIGSGIQGLQLCHLLNRRHRNLLWVD